MKLLNSILYNLNFTKILVHFNIEKSMYMYTLVHVYVCINNYVQF